MKQFLLTLLGASLLCGLSPHPLSAQETTPGNVLHMDFNKRADGHNEDLTFSGILQTLSTAGVCTFYQPDVKCQWPTTDVGLFPYITNTTATGTTKWTYAYKRADGTVAYPTYSSGADYDGVKTIENNDIKLEFNYKYAIAKSMTAVNNKIHFASQIRVGKPSWDTEETEGTNEGGLYLYPGVTFKLTPKKGKLIKKITIKTPYESTTFTSARLKANVFAYQTPDDEDFSTADIDPQLTTTVNNNATITYGTYSYNSTTRAQAEITFPDSYPGEYSQETIVLGLKSSGLYPYNYGTGQNQYAAITQNNITQLREPFGISSIDVEYYDESELPKYINTVTCGKDNNDKIEVEQDGTFVDVSTLTESTLSDDNLKLRIGDAIVEIARTGSTPAGKPTVTFDTELGWIGVHAYCTIKAYLDPEKYRYNGAATQPYKMTYIINGFMKGSEKMYASYQSVKSMGSNTATTSTLNASGYTCTAIATSTSTTSGILSLSNLTGIKANVTLDVKPANTAQTNWGAPFYTMTSATTTTVPTTGPYNAMNGDDPAFAFDGIEFLFPSDSPTPPSAPTVSADITETAPGVYHTAAPFDITLSQNNDSYESNLIKYIISDTQLDADNIDWSTATEYTAPINVTASKYIYAIVVSTFEGNTYLSSPTEITATFIETIKIASLADLNKADNDGQTVLLQMPLIVNVNADVYPQDATAGYTQAAYLRDIDGNGVKVISRTASQTDAKLPSVYAAASQEKSKISLISENTVVGRYCYNDGKNPCIVIRDLMDEKAADYYNYQGNTTTTITDQIELLTAVKYATDQDYNTITPDLFGKRIFVRGLKWDATELSLTAIAADDTDPLKTVKVRVGTSTDGALSSLKTLPTLSEDKIYDVQAILEYDAETDEYFLAPIAFYEQFEMPQLTGPETIKDKLKDITDEDDDTKVIGAEYTDDFTDGTINLTFQMEKPTTGTTIPSYYYWSIVKENGSNVASSPTTVSTGTTTFTATLRTEALDFDKETGSSTVYAYCYYTNNFNTTNSGQRFKIVIRDAVQNGPKVATGAELREKINSGEIDPVKGEYITFDGRFAVVAKSGTTLLIRDISKDLPLNPADVTDPADIKKAIGGSYLVITDNDGWNDNIVGFSRYENTWKWYYRAIEVGDEITHFIAKTYTDSHGNTTLDVTGLHSFSNGTALFEYVPDYIRVEAVNGFNFGTPRFMPYMTTGEKDEANNWIINEANPVTHPVNKALSEITTDPLHPDNVEFDNSMLDTELHVMNVAIREKASDDPDAEKDYEAVVTADGLTLLWDMFGTDVDPDADVPALAAEEAGDESADDNAATAMSVKKQLAAHLANGEKAFNVLGVLRKHTDGKYALQVENIEPTPKDVPATFFADGKKIDGYDHQFVKRIDLTTDMPDEALIKMTVGDGEQEAYDPEKLKGIEADTKVTIERWVPGTIKIQPTTITLTKLSTDVNTLAEMAQGDNADNLYHFRKHLKVVAAAGGTVMAADADGYLAVVEAAPAEAAEGKYLADIVLVRNGKNTASVHEIDADAELLDEDDSYAIITPATTTLFGATVAEGNATDAEGNIYVIDPTFAAIPQGDAEAWSLTGYILPGADDKPVIYLTASKDIKRVALPVITPAEAAFLDQTTFTIDCATTGAAIEYSLDGGKTWLPYNGAPVKVEATCEILARATAAEMLPSHEAKASVVREYLSGDVNITVDEQDGKTVITITGPGKIYYSIDGAAEKLYDGAITIDNNTQAELSGIIRAYAVEEGKRAGNPKEESYKVSGISGVGADEAEIVSVEGNTIIVPEGAQTFDIAGRRVNPQGLPRGIYIVRLASGKAVKAVVK